MDLILTGAHGMLGADLCACLSKQHTLTCWDVADLDITDTSAVLSSVDRIRPDAVIHCAAFTNVDGCESDPVKAYQANAFGTWNIAAACQRVGAILVYVSTDFVFDGEKGEPYTEFDPANPLNEYGRSKLAGEIIVRELVERHFIVRTAWLFGMHGSNFVRTILEHAKNKDTLRVVADQYGCPTYTADLAVSIAELLENPLYGTYHITNAGSCSWAEFAEEIVRQAGLKARVAHIASDEWETPTRRPRDSRLRHLALEMQGRDTLRPWQEALAEFVEECRKE